MKSILALLGGAFVATQANHGSVQAIFSHNGLEGYVMVQDGIIDININASGVNTALFPMGCFDSGLKWHVHEIWTWADTDDRILGNCSGDYTAGHFDPYAACGSASGNDWCDQCVETAYPCDWDSNPDPYSCEVGDWSAKYGLITDTGGDMVYTGTYGEDSWGEITGAQLLGQSIVFHCDSPADRIFCAPFEDIDTDNDNEPTERWQQNALTLRADFTDAFGAFGNDEAYVEVSYDGSVVMKFDSGITIPGVCLSQTYEFLVYEQYDSNEWSSVMCDAANADVGMYYDPTNQCADMDTANENCAGIYLCNDTNYMYSCDFENDPFSCSPTDFSGRYGTVDLSEVFGDYLISTNDRYLIDLDDLMSRSLVMRCTDDQSIIACSQFRSMGPGFAKAMFSNNGLDGYVMVEDGTLSVNLDVSGVDVADLPSATCFDGGLGMHIHMLWTYGDYVDRIGSADCHGDFTGGHWDPWLACGGATGNADCREKGGCVNSSYVIDDTDTYQCSAATYEANAFACEVGDWSNKYGSYVVTDNMIDRTDTSRYEVDAFDLSGLSVVFHCSDGNRAFCAPFQVYGQDPNRGPSDNAANDGSEEVVIVTADFGSMGMIELRSNYGQYDVDLTINHDTVICDGNINYAIFSDNACTMIYDPTHSCIEKSDSPFCAGTTQTCGDGDMYSCSFDDDPYLCSPSDLSGKYGPIDAESATGTISYDIDGYDDLMIPLDQVVGKYIGLYCYDGSLLSSCVQIMEEEPTTTEAPDTTPEEPTEEPDTTESEDAAPAFTLFFTAVVVCLAFLF